jgi:hypothetical protein
LALKERAKVKNEYGAAVTKEKGLMRNLTGEVNRKIITTRSKTSEPRDNLQQKYERMKPILNKKHNREEVRL